MLRADPLSPAGPSQSLPSVERMTPQHNALAQDSPPFLPPLPFFLSVSALTQDVSVIPLNRAVPPQLLPLFQILEIKVVFALDEGKLGVFPGLNRTELYGT